MNSLGSACASRDRALTASRLGQTSHGALTPADHGRYDLSVWSDLFIAAALAAAAAVTRREPDPLPQVGPWPHRMRAVQITRFGGPEVLDVVDLPDPVPGPGEKLYEVSSAGINYADTHQAVP
jgi:hypothetical protein